ncbi:MAG: hypothetical protein ACOZE5_08185 [Verrucomicrobiota bacterium]
MNEFRLQAAVGLLPITLTCVRRLPWLPGVVYGIIGPQAAWNGIRHGRQIQAAPGWRRDAALRAPAPA